MHGKLVGQNCRVDPCTVCNKHVMSDTKSKLLHLWCSEEACLEGADLHCANLMIAG